MVLDTILAQVKFAAYVRGTTLTNTAILHTQRCAAETGDCGLKQGNHRQSKMYVGSAAQMGGTEHERGTIALKHPC